MRLLLAEDERILSDALVEVLTHNNYSVDAVYNGQDAIDYLLAGNYDAAILDIMMPKKDGISVLKELRSAGFATPVIMLTAKSQIEDRVEGLDSGADDYLTKPFAMAELLARVRAISRRQPELTGTDLKFVDLKLDRADYSLSGPDGRVRLANKEFQIMEMLMANSGQVISTERFMERVWGYDSEAEINVVWVNISGLRKKIATLGAHVQIKAARGVGYSLEATDGK
ncbi:MAG: response regulator transcription factor [Firmicutes bacterium]|nr:response regulator transcription factor [Bacillota bacterium]